jgi:hypothetical protein
MKVVRGLDGDTAGTLPAYPTACRRGVWSGGLDRECDIDERGGLALRRWPVGVALRVARMGSRVGG